MVPRGEGLLLCLLGVERILGPELCGGAVDIVGLDAALGGGHRWAGGISGTGAALQQVVGGTAGVEGLQGAIVGLGQGLEPTRGLAA